MILTVTLNPSIDIYYNINNLVLGNVNRVSCVKKTAGGKGINVSRVLNQVSEPIVATGIVGGFLGQQIEDDLDKLGIEYKFLRINQQTRNCIGIIHGENQTEILEQGPVLDMEDIEKFKKYFKNILSDADFVTMSGSLMKGMPDNFYVELIRICNSMDKKVILDTSGNALLEVLKSDVKPFAVKPNIEELKYIIGSNIVYEEKILKNELNKPIFDDVENIFLSMGARGMLARIKSKFYKVEIPKIKTVNTIGSGDSTVAGIAYGFRNKMSIEDILKIANTFGILNAMESETGYINTEKIEEISNKIMVKVFN